MVTSCNSFYISNNIKIKLENGIVPILYKIFLQKLDQNRGWTFD